MNTPKPPSAPPRLNGAGAATEGLSVLQQHRLRLEAQLKRLDLPDAERLGVQLELSRVLLDVGEASAACAMGRTVLESALACDQWAIAAEACHIMYLSEQEEAVPALGHGVWLAIACPIDPELSLQLLRDLVEEMPPQADGAAVAAMLGYFLMEQRTAESERDRLVFMAKQLVAEVAEHHRGITDDEAIGIWVQMHELDDVDVLLERMARMLEVIVPTWWFDREALRARFPGVSE